MRKAIILLLILSNYCFSQEIEKERSSKDSFSLHFGTAIPLFEFADVDINSNKAGGAKPGLNVGIEITHPLKFNGLVLFLGLDFNYNGLEDKVKIDFKDDLIDQGVPDPDIKYFKYYTTAASTGLRYEEKLSERISLYGEAGITINLLKITDLVVVTRNITFTQSTESAFGSGYKVKAGIILDRKYIVSIDYLALGSHNFTTIMSAKNIPSQKIEASQTVDILAITLGFIF